MKYCSDCNANVDEADQTDHEHKNGICPCCGGESVVELPEDMTKI